MKRLRFIFVVAASTLSVLIGMAGLLLLIAFYAHRSHDFRYAPPVKSAIMGVKIYAVEHDGVYPALSSLPGRLMFDTDDMYPDYLAVPWLLMSHADPAWIEGKPDEYYFENSSYFYLGYAVWNDEMVALFADAYTKRIDEGLPFDTDLPVDSPIEQIRRLNDSVYRQMIPESEANLPKWKSAPDSEIPVFIERPHSYPGALGVYLFGPVIPLSRSAMGGNVAYKDGHIEFIKYPGKWPMTEATIDALSRLEALRK
ncbi:MAG: hypothetical protein AMXMBFR84_31740 [Candidatus Hydrogenedentota bacterium]